MDPARILGFDYWPAWLFFRARLWLASMNQAESDRAENEAAERAAGIRR